jgi:hypothetical protein
MRLSSAVILVIAEGWIRGIHAHLTGLLQRYGVFSCCVGRQIHTRRRRQRTASIRCFITVFTAIMTRALQVRMCDTIHSSHCNESRVIWMLIHQHRPLEALRHFHSCIMLDSHFFSTQSSDRRQDLSFDPRNVGLMSEEVSLHSRAFRHTVWLILLANFEACIKFTEKGFDARFCARIGFVGKRLLLGH